MPAEITEILDAVKVALETAYPDIPVRVKAKPATEPGKLPAPGYTVGSKIPCFIVTEWNAERVDESASFELITLGYPVTIEYLKAAAPENWADDPDVRTKRIELEDLLYRNGVAGVPANVFDVRFATLPVYQSNEAENAVASGVVFVYTLQRARPGV